MVVRRITAVFLMVVAMGAVVAEPTTERVSVSTSGAQGNGAVLGRPAISAYGRYVAFASSAYKLVPNDRNNASDVFVRDRVAGTTQRRRPGSCPATAN
jgi:hypothetical protein